MEDSTKPPGQNSGENTGLIPQPHGGALLPGGVVGHKGGPGRPRSKFIERARRVFREKRGISTIGDLLSSDEVSPKDKIACAKLLAEWGFAAEIKKTVDVNLNGNLDVQHSGVLVVPGKLAKSEWEEAASKQQDQLAQAVATDGAKE